MLPIIILAGGRGTRLKSAVPDLPKCLAPVGGSSFIELLLARLASFGASDVYLSLGYKSDLVIPVLQKQASIKNIHWFVESLPLGTGGAIKACMDEFGLSEALVINGDTWLEGDLLSMLQLSVKEEYSMIMGVVLVADRERYGGVEISNGIVTGYGEKDNNGPGLINGGIYCLKAECFSFMESKTNFSFESAIIPKLVKSKLIQAVVLGVDFIDIGVPDDYYSFVARHGN